MLRPRILGVVISESWSGGVEIDISQSGHTVWAVGFEAGEVVAGKGRRWNVSRSAGLIGEKRRRWGRWRWRVKDRRDSGAEESKHSQSILMTNPHSKFRFTDI